LFFQSIGDDFGDWSDDGGDGNLGDGDCGGD